MLAVLDVIMLALRIYTWLVIAMVIMSWLVAFGVINTRNDFVRMIFDFLHRVTEPALSRIRRIMPDLGGIDLSPIILLLGIFFLQQVIIRYLYPIAF
ncbi:MAG: YggT family protein [Saliniramus fredricksonii]|uniref:YggT family protein n=1 Tax=Saliniramus fredricksonii TaxID=1653334 RepID=A0A0P8BQ23_9HYPH|nr:YggT family protein [Saliniramus fredricksonii]KPQ11675.1 MAG: YggT family protein [Saliniramus fredricksonii]SCC80256.1 YggT family protein [Saliniramus fredricksonii]